MTKIPLPDREQERLELLEKLEIMDTAIEKNYDAITYLASHICQTPIALICFLDAHRQWFKSHLGLDAEETSRDLAFCSYTILGNELMTVKDAKEDNRFAHNPLVLDDPKIRFYAGVPLEVLPNLNVGTLCVIDREPRELSDEQIKCLKLLANEVISELQLRLKIKENEKLQKKERLFLSMIAHEIRNPTTTILSAVDFIKNNDYQIESILPVIDSCAHNISLICNDLLDIKKFEKGTFTLNKRKEDFSACILKVVDQYAYAAKNKNITISTELSPIIPHFAFDPDRICQVLSNVISNALKYADADISIKTKANDGVVEVYIQDNGKGIPPEVQSKLFTLYGTSESLTTSSGSGLGLYISRKIVEAHGGRMSFTSEPNVETTFWFTLPIVDR